MDVILTIEHAKDVYYSETDSILVCQIFISI